MKKLFATAILLGAALGALPPASAATIYTEDWGNANTSVRFNGSLNLVGWTAVAQSQTAQPYLGVYGATGANDPVLGLGLPPNTVYFTGLVGASQTGPGMIYTTDSSGAGSAGDSAFADINPASYTNLTFNVEVRNGGGNLTNYFAVQVGGSWYVATNNPMPVFTGGYPSFTNWTMVYTNSASVWNNLTIGANSVTIGSTAGANLSGAITGIGIVELNDPNQSGGGVGFNYNQIVINQGRGDFPSNPPTNTAAAITPQTVYVGGGASFVTTFSGTPTLVYAWETNGGTLSNGGRVSGANTGTLTITNINASDASPTYSVVVTNFFGQATNGGNMLVVNPVPADYLYAETFPYVGPNGNLPITGVGWLGAFQGSTGIYSSGPGIGNVFSYSGVATTNVYYTSVTNDTGASGLPFVSINPEAYPNVTFQANFTPGNGAALDSSNVVAYWAVQMASSNWYSSAARIPVETISQNNYQPYQLAFSRARTNWNTLTIGANSGAIGGLAASNLTGNITGAGVVIAHLGLNGGGDFNFNTFLLTTDAVTVLPPSIDSSGTPNSQSAPAGGGASFGVVASGQQPFTYGWALNGVPLVNGGRISGANTPTVTIANLTTNDSGTITAYVTNSIGSTSSDGVVSPNPSLMVTNPAVGVLYSETFPFVGPLAGNYPISSAGWVEAVAGAPNALYETVGSDGAVFAYLGTPGTTVYYATTATDTNQAGLPFPNIGLAFYPDLTFSVDIAPNFAASNVTAYLAVQLGANWYVAASPLPVPTASDSSTFSTYTAAFNPAAANWKNLTVTGSGGLIGSPAAANLRGVMTGAGVVFVTVGTGGTFNFDNFLITGTGVGGIIVGPATNGTVNLSWVGNPAVNLQSATSLNPANWADVPNTLGLYSLPVSLTGPQKYFRLVQHQ